MVKNVRHTGIVVEDMEASLPFYRDLLGFEIYKKMDESGAYIDNISGLKQVQVTTIKMRGPDGSGIELLHYASHSRTQKARDLCEIGVSHMAFTVDNLDDYCEKFKTQGIAFNAPPQLSPDGYAKVTFCRAPEGTFIELVELLEPS